MHLHMDETKFPCVGMSAELQGTHAKHQLQYQNVCAKMFLDEMLKPHQNKKGQKNLGYPRKKQSF